MSKSMLLAVLCRIQVILRGSLFSRSGKRRPWSNFWVIENLVVSYTPVCLKVVIEPFTSNLSTWHPMYAYTGEKAFLVFDGICSDTSKNYGIYKGS